MKNIQETIKICSKCPASNCLFKKRLQKEGKIEVKYFWKEVAGGWQKLIGGKIIKKR